MSGSQAINAGNDAACPSTDQLGTPRNGPCDIGAVEFYPVVNDLVALANTTTAFDPTPVPGGPAGTFRITAEFTDTSNQAIGHHFAEVVELTGGNLLLNADGGAGGVGARVTLSENTSRPFVPGATETFEFIIGMQKQDPFTFSVNMLGDRLPTGDTKLTASDAAGAEGFGRYLALSRDGGKALVGADNAVCSTGATACGAAYIFVREKRSAWVEQRKLTATDAAANANFGFSVSLSADGETALIGAPAAGPRAAGCPAFSCGAAYVFVRRGGEWVEQQTLTGSDAGIGADFGWSVALSADGETALIGAIGVRCPTGTNACGAVYVFVREKRGLWVERQKLVASKASGGEGFGRSLALAGDGKTALIGAFFAGCSVGGACGTAYAFIREKHGIWVEQEKLTASDEAANAAFGFSVSLTADGDTALIGAPNVFCPSGGLFCGAAYVFARKGSKWFEQQKLTVSNAAGGGVFGFSVALSARGETALIGDRDAECSALGGECGAAYLFFRHRANWVEQEKLTAFDAAYADFFGQAVALSGNGRTALVGSDNPFCPVGINCGAAYVFRE